MRPGDPTCRTIEGRVPSPLRSAAAFSLHAVPSRFPHAVATSCGDGNQSWTHRALSSCRRMLDFTWEQNEPISLGTGVVSLMLTPHHNAVARI